MLLPKMPSPECGRNFLDIDPFLTRMVPIASSHSQLSIGTGLVKNGSTLRKLWSNLLESFQQGTENDPENDDICAVGKLSSLAFDRYRSRQKRIFIKKIMGPSI